MLNDSVTTRVETTRRIELGYNDLAEILAERFNIAPDAKIFVRVPGGGDWSNTDLEIGDVPLVIVSKMVEETR